MLWLLQPSPDFQLKLQAFICLQRKAAKNDIKEPRRTEGAAHDESQNAPSLTTACTHLHALARTRMHTITPSFLGNANTHSSAPAGSWRFAWCRRQGIRGAVLRKWRGVNWVSAGCKGLTRILSVLCHSLHHPPLQPPHPLPSRTITPWDTGGQSGDAEWCLAILGGCYFLQLFTFYPCFSQSAVEHVKGGKGRCEKGWR